MSVIRQKVYIRFFAAQRNIDACVKAFIHKVKMFPVRCEGIAR